MPTSPHPAVSPAAAWLLASLLLSVGCVRHEVVVRNGDATQPGGASDAVINLAAVRDLPAATTIAGPLPQDLRVVAWRRDEHTGISSFSAHTRTPLPWWQRFPVDLATDLMPIDLVARSEMTIVTTPLPQTDVETLAAEARRAGYARPAADASRPSE
jgi:hypothetical protein